MMFAYRRSPKDPKDGVQLIRIGRDFNSPFPDLEQYQQQVAFTHLLNLEGMTEQKLWEGYKKRE